jgi:hypothetical protein
MFKTLAFTSYTNQIIIFFFKAKAVHSLAPILPSYNYCGNLAHKASECNILFEELFCDYCGKEGHHETVCFAKFSEQKQLQLPRQNLPASSVAPQPKAKAPQPSTQALPTKGNSVRMLRRRSTMLTRGRCFKPMPFKFKLYK